jgi:AcrR family transcriptional regulator
MPLVKSRAEVDSRRELIIETAAELFVEVGYGAASMSAIAAKLGGSKGTLYNYFKSKEELFEAYVRRHCGRTQEAIFGLLANGGDTRSCLARLGRELISNILSDYTLRNFRVIVAEAERAPSLGLALYEAGPQSGAARLAAFLADAARRGDLEVPDPLAAAQQFVSLCLNWRLRARLCGVVPEPTSEEVTRDVDGAVETFMAAFGPSRRRPALVAG